jgi:uncharacterized protein (DUF58 family)
MPAVANNRFLDPAVLAELSSLDLIARTVVDGFVAGLHRSPDFGFSQEFAEYRAYTPGDDLRHVDWNVFARTEKAYLKRYRGETNTEIVVMLDTSASMNFTSHAVSKLVYAKFMASALVYLAHLQRDSTGLIAFHDDAVNYIPPSSRQGQLMRLFHAIDGAESGTRTDFERPFAQLQEFRKRRGITILISDFLIPVESTISAIEPLRFRGNEVILFHLLDPEELKPGIKDPVLLVDMETNEDLEVSPEYARGEYESNIAAHVGGLRSEAQKAGLEYFFVRTDQPLDAALREYFAVRQRRQ